MDAKSSMISPRWHIPRPSLSSGGDTRSRGGSASSQGSTSNHSTQSASSGSMLLSAANLASVRPADYIADVHVSRHDRHRHTPCKPDYELPIPEETRHPDHYWSDVKRGSESVPDVASVVSSTHFTVVNGFTKHHSQKEAGSCCCSHSHQITVLVICMTVLLSACVLAAICFVEMRIRRDTSLYKYS